MSKISIAMYKHEAEDFFERNFENTTEVLLWEEKIKAKVTIPPSEPTIAVVEILCSSVKGHSLAMRLSEHTTYWVSELLNNEDNHIYLNGQEKVIGITNDLLPVYAKFNEVSLPEAYPLKRTIEIDGIRFKKDPFCMVYLLYNGQRLKNNLLNIFLIKDEVYIEN